MGASLSNLSEGGASGSNGPGLGDIPEACVACVFIYLTPIEICNLARLNRAFRGAASSDSVWESKLPVNYQHLLHLLPPETYQDLSKKDVFALFAKSVKLDDNTKQFWVDKVTGRVCLSVSARAMSIIGIEDRRYWSWIPTEESRWLSGNVGPFPTCRNSVIEDMKDQVWGHIKGSIPVNVFVRELREGHMPLLDILKSMKEVL